MELSSKAQALVNAIHAGLPVTPRPYRVVAERLGMDEAEVIELLRSLSASGVIKRFGVVVRHRALGYRANAMVVWDVADTVVDAVGEWLGAQRRVTLCYQRPRRPPHWPYNLFCMIHGHDESEVRDQIARLREDPRLSRVPYSVLFSTRQFKQRGARYDVSNGVSHDDA